MFPQKNSKSFYRFSHPAILKGNESILLLIQPLLEQRKIPLEITYFNVVSFSEMILRDCRAGCVYLSNPSLKF
jgi:hypothetical protein